MRQNCMWLGSKIQVLWHDSKMTTSMMQRCSPRLDPNFEVPGNVLGITLQSDDNHRVPSTLNGTRDFSLRNQRETVQLAGSPSPVPSLSKCSHSDAADSGETGLGCHRGSTAAETRNDPPEGGRIVNGTIASTRNVIALPTIEPVGSRALTSANGKSNDPKDEKDNRSNP
jgi:hypothetical protein